MASRTICSTISIGRDSGINSRVRPTTEARGGRSKVHSALLTTLAIFSIFSIFQYVQYVQYVDRPSLPTTHIKQAMSALLSRTPRSFRLAPVKALWKHPIRCLSLLGEETVPLAFDKIETSKTRNMRSDHLSKHTGAIVFVHGLLYAICKWYLISFEYNPSFSLVVQSKIGDPLAKFLRTKCRSLFTP